MATVMGYHDVMRFFVVRLFNSVYFRYCFFCFSAGPQGRRAVVLRRSKPAGHINTTNGLHVVKRTAADTGQTTKVLGDRRRPGLIEISIGKKCLIAPLQKLKRNTIKISKNQTRKLKF